MLLRAIGAGIAYFIIVFSCGFALGTIRVLFIAPAAGQLAGVILELPVMLAISWLACRRIVNLFRLDQKSWQRFVMGGLAFSLMMIAELEVAALLFQQTLADYLRGMFSLPGNIGLAAQIMFAIFPIVQKLRNISAPR